MDQSKYKRNYGKKNNYHLVSLFKGLSKEILTKTTIIVTIMAYINLMKTPEVSKGNKIAIRALIASFQARPATKESAATMYPEV